MLPYNRVQTYDARLADKNIMVIFHLALFQLLHSVEATPATIESIRALLLSVWHLGCGESSQSGLQVPPGLAGTIHSPRCTPSKPVWSLYIWVYTAHWVCSQRSPREERSCFRITKPAKKVAFLQYNVEPTGYEDQIQLKVHGPCQNCKHKKNHVPSA